MEEREKLTGTLEAVLFAHGEPLGVDRLAEIAGVSPSEAEAGISSLQESLDADPSRGLALLRHDGSAQLVTHPRHAAALAELLRAELSQDLGPASLETLALVAYFGPVTRATIDHVRGVSSAMSLRTLLVRGLIERVREGKGEHSYRLTPEMLRDLGIVEAEALPDFAELSQLLARSLASRQEPAARVAEPEA